MSKLRHLSSCAVHNEPALPAEECNCLASKHPDDMSVEELVLAIQQLSYEYHFFYNSYAEKHTYTVICYSYKNPEAELSKRLSKRVDCKADTMRDALYSSVRMLGEW